MGKIFNIAVVFVMQIIENKTGLKATRKLKQYVIEKWVRRG